MDDRTAVRQISTAHLLRPLSRELLRLLRNLSGEDWIRRTSAPEWSVRDVVAHLLDLDLRRVSVARDGHYPPAPVAPLDVYDVLVDYLNDLNAEWVRAARRLSPRVLIECLEVAASSHADLAEAADPDAAATFPVAWAGQTSSPMWLDVAREYIERWHHQDQIRDAVGAPPLSDRQWLLPVLEVSLLALPHAYRSVPGAEGTRVRLSVSGPAGGEWHLERAAGSWQIRAGATEEAASTVRAGDLELARLLLHRLDPAQVAHVVEVEGEAVLAAPLLAARAVMVHVPGGATESEP